MHKALQHSAAGIAAGMAASAVSKQTLCCWQFFVTHFPPNSETFILNFHVNTAEKTTLAYNLHISALFRRAHHGFTFMFQVGALPCKMGYSLLLRNIHKLYLNS